MVYGEGSRVITLRLTPSPVDRELARYVMVTLYVYHGCECNRLNDGA